MTLSDNDRPAENKSMRFIRLAESRVNGLINSIRLLKQLSNKNNYEYSDEQRKRIFSAVRSALSDADEAFKGINKDRNKFKL